MSEYKVHEFRLEGMSCAGCAARIEQNLNRDPAVERAVVNFAMGSLAVGTSMSEAEVTAHIEQLGFKAFAREDISDWEQREAKQLRADKFNVLLAFCLTIPVFVIAMGHLGFRGSGWVEFVLTTLVLAYPGRGFFVRAYARLRQLESNMDTLVAVGTSAAWAYSVIQLLYQGQSAHLYFEGAAVIVTLVLFGKYLEERAKNRASQSIRSLMKMQPSIVRLLEDGSSQKTREVPLKLVRIGDVALVRAGERIPVDGQVLRGSSSADMSMLTGESQPVDLHADSTVYAGTVNLEGALEISVQGAGDDTELARIIRLVETAQSTKAPIQRLADYVSGIFVPIVIAIALLTFGLWWIFADNVTGGLMAAVSVLIVSCPCALGLATPMALLVASGNAAKRGLVIRDAPSLETLHKANAIVFDKTGTLTMGEPTVAEVTWASDLAEADKPLLLRALWEAERRTSHPFASALVHWLEHEHGEALNSNEALVVDDFEQLPGLGVKANVLLASGVERSLYAGRPTEESERVFGSELLPGRSVVAVHWQDLPVLQVCFVDPLRPDASQAVNDLKKRGLLMVMATGDSWESAKTVADELKIEVMARVSPEGKADIVRELQKKSYTVIMAGDGVNDAPALAQADVGIALSSGTEVAAQTAGIILHHNSISRIAETIALSRRTFNNIRQNLFWAFIYNLILIPVAALGFLNPMLAALAMSCSSLFVVGNSLRLKHRS
jgi:heavy metal translocating P-type ATPase